MSNRCPECARLRAERDEAIALVREQFDDLANLRQEMKASFDRLREQHGEILRLVGQRDELGARLEAARRQ
jgi:prefoldin subunit 5